MTNPMKAPLEAWLNKPLYRFCSSNVLTVGEACEGIQVFGGTGSGKSSASGRALAVAMLRAGFGGLVLTAKSDDLGTWLGYFRDAASDPGFDPQFSGDRRRYDPIERGRLVVVGPGTGYHFNPLDYEYRLAAGEAAATASSRQVNLIVTALGSGSGVASQADGTYWEDALKELLSHAIDLIRFGSGEVSDGQFCPADSSPSLQQIQDVIRTAPQSLPEARTSAWQRSDSACVVYLNQAYENLQELRKTGATCSAETIADIQDTCFFWLHGFPTLTDRTRSVVVSSFTAKASSLLRAPLRSLLCREGPSASHPLATPESTYEGRVVLINLPVKSFGTQGEFAQRLIKTVWQHATESNVRDVTVPCLPAFLFADEAQHFVSAEEDVLYQATARSKLAPTVYLTQNIANYYTRLRGASSGVTDALLGSLQTKIFHTNGEVQTNEWAERLLGHEESEEPQRTRSTPLTGEGGSTSETKVYRRIPFANAYEFSELRKGGYPLGRSEAIVFMPGKKWHSCQRRDEKLERKLVTQGIAGRAIRHLFLQQGDRQPCAKGDCRAI